MVPLESSTALGLDQPTEISPDPHPQKSLGTKERHHQASPPTCKHHHGLVVTIPVSSRPMVHGLYTTPPGQGQQLCSHARGAHLHRRAAFIDRIEHQGNTRPTLAWSGPDEPVKPRQPCCNMPTVPPPLP
jgi:hypothetical protein